MVSKLEHNSTMSLMALVLKAEALFAIDCTSVYEFAEQGLKE